MQVIKDVQSSGTNYVDANNVLHIGSVNRGVLLNSASQISGLQTDLFVPGEVAHTAGWQNAWELSVAGTWVSVIGS